MTSKAKTKIQYREEDKRQMILLCISVFVVFIVSIWYLEDNYFLKVWGDEFGYWQSAAYLTGKDWSSVASTNSYYGYGFGILLAPIMLLFGHDAALMLQASFVFEAILLSSCVVAAYLCIGYFSENINGLTRILMAVLPALYPTYILKVNQSEAEILLVALTWWYSYCALRFIKEKKISQAVIIAALSVFSYAVHQRTIHVMAISVLLIVWVFRKKLLNPKLLAIVAIFIVGLVLVNLFKSLYVSDMYASSGGAAMQSNNLSSESSKVIKILTTFDGFKNFLLSLIGKFYYIAVASCMLVVLGIIYCIRDLFIVLRTKEKVERLVSMLLVTFNFLGAYLICAISISDEFVSRSDLMIYGRYMEHAIGPLLVLGLLWLYEVADIKTILGTISAVGLSTFVVANTIQIKSSNDNLWRNCTAIADLYEGSRYKSEEGLYIAVFRAIILVLLLYFASTFKDKRKNYLYNIAVVCVGVFWINVGFTVLTERVFPWAEDLYCSQTEVLNFVDEEEFGIYDSYIGGFFQFLRVDDKVHYFSSMEDIEKMSKPMYIISYTKGETADMIRWKEDVIMENDLYILWRAYPE